MSAKRSLARGFPCILAVAVVWAWRAAADTTNAFGTGDARYRGKDVGLGTYAPHGNGGAKSNVRVGKPYLANAWQNYALFDWNRTNILTDLEPLARTNGWAGLSEAYQRGGVRVELGLRINQTDTNPPLKSVLVGFFASQTAWVEGDGTDQDSDYGGYGAAGWTSNSSACTDSYAVDWRPGDSGAGAPVPWRENGTNLANFRAFKTIQWNSVKLTNNLTQSVVHAYVTLDPALWWNYLHATQVGPGLVTKDGGTGGQPNLTAWARDQGTTVDPELRVTISRFKRRPTGVALQVR